VKQFHKTVRESYGFAHPFSRGRAHRTAAHTIALRERMLALATTVSRSQAVAPKHVRRGACATTYATFQLQYANLRLKSNLRFGLREPSPWVARTFASSCAAPPRAQAFETFTRSCANLCLELR